MVERQERLRAGETAGWGGRESWEERRSVRADTPRPDDGRLVRNTRGSREGVMRSGSGKSVERARKEVRWSKDVDYEG